MPHTPGSGPVPTRRQLLRAIGASGLATGLAGCTDLASYSFSATPVRIDERARADLGATVVDDRRIENEYTRTVVGVDARVTVESHYAAYATPGSISFGDAEHGRVPESSDGKEGDYQYGSEASGPVDPGTIMANTQTIGVLATPKADVGGRRLNPFAAEPVPDLVTGRNGRDLLARLGVDRTAKLLAPLEYVGAVTPSSIADAISPSSIADAITPSSLAGAVTPSDVHRFVGAVRDQSDDERLVLASVGRRDVGSDAVLVAGVQQVPADLAAIQAPYSDHVSPPALDASTGLLVALSPFLVPEDQSLQVDPGTHTLGTGEYVSDREDASPDLAVTLLTADIPIESWRVFRSETVADQNPQYDPAEPVVVVAYERLLDEGWADWRTASPGTLFDDVVARGIKFHAFPRTRLRRHLLAATASRTG